MQDYGWRMQKGEEKNAIDERVKYVIGRRYLPMDFLSAKLVLKLRLLRRPRSPHQKS